MKNAPLVSVVIPTYNRANLVCQTIDNVLEQTYENYEIIIVDDGSTDDTQRKLEKFRDKVRIVTQANSGPAVARNRGASISRGDIIAFQDSDDLWQPSKLARQVHLMEMNRSVPCCLCGIAMRFENGKPFTSFDHSLVRLDRHEGLWLNVLDVLATRFILFNQAAAIRRAAFEKIGGFAEDLRYLEDYDLPLRLALEGPWAFIRDALVTYGAGSPASFSEQAKADPVVLQECEVAVFERIIGRLETKTLDSSVRRSLARRARVARRRLAALNFRQTHQGIGAVASELIVGFDRYWLAALRKAPWFPQPITVPL